MFLEIIITGNFIWEHKTEVGIYKRNKKTRTRPRKRPRKQEEMKENKNST